MRCAMCLKGHVAKHVKHARRRMVVGDGDTMRRVCKPRVVLEDQSIVSSHIRSSGFIIVWLAVLLCCDYAFYTTHSYLHTRRLSGVYFG
jgi:hypothetical protein